MEQTRITNRIFLHHLLLSGMLGVFILFLIDTRNGFNDRISVITDTGTFVSLLVGYLISKILKKDDLAVVLFTSLLLLVMIFLFLNSTGYYLGISILVIIVIGYAYSLMLKGHTRIVMQLMTLTIMLGLMFYQNFYPEKFVDQSHMDLIATALPSIFVYIIIASTAAILKDRLDKANIEVREINADLTEKNQEIKSQNEELNSQQEELNSLNSNLESLVENRTRMLQKKNEQLTHYAFRNAHNVRGPLARILGLLILHKADKSISAEQILAMIEKEAKDMDVIVLEIARELGEVEG